MDYTKLSANVGTPRYTDSVEDELQMFSYEPSSINVVGSRFTDLADGPSVADDHLLWSNEAWVDENGYPTEILRSIEELSLCCEPPIEAGAFSAPGTWSRQPSNHAESNSIDDLSSHSEPQIGADTFEDAVASSPASPIMPHAPGNHTVGNYREPAREAHSQPRGTISAFRNESSSSPLTLCFTSSTPCHQQSRYAMSVSRASVPAVNSKVKEFRPKRPREEEVRAVPSELSAEDSRSAKKVKSCESKSHAQVAPQASAPARNVRRDARAHPQALSTTPEPNTKVSRHSTMARRCKTAKTKQANGTFML